MNVLFHKLEGQRGPVLMKKTFILFLILFLAGVLSAQLFGSEFLATYGFLNEYHLQSFAAAKIQKVDLFWNVLWERGKLFLFLTILLLTPARRAVPSITGGLLSATAGLYGTACVMLFGIRGVGLFFCSLLPQWIFYFLAGFFLFRLQRPVLNNTGKEKVSYVFSVLLILILIVVGCIVEVTFGMGLLQWCLRGI